jgi:hypothetical protein
MAAASIKIYQVVESLSYWASTQDLDTESLLLETTVTLYFECFNMGGFSKMEVDNLSLATGHDGEKCHNITIPQQIILISRKVAVPLIPHKGVVLCLFKLLAKLRADRLD